MKSLNNYISESERISSKDEYIAESKKLNIYEISEGLVNLIADNAKDLDDVVASFIEEVEDLLDEKNPEYLKAFRKAVLDYAKTW